MIIRNNKHSLYSNSNFMTHLTFEADSRIHSHVYFEFAYVVEGEIRHICNKKGNVMQVGDIVLLRPGDIHTYERFGECTHRDVVVTEDYFKSICDALSPLAYPYILSSPSCLYSHMTQNQLNYFEETLIHICNTLGTTPLQGIDTVSLSCSSLISSLLTLFLIQEGPIHANYPEWIKTILERCTKKSYQLADMNTLLHGISYSHTHICRTFKQYVGHTITEHINAIRLENGRSLLVNTTKPIPLIAEELGFENPTYFTKLFKKTYKITPMQYRKQIISPPPPRKK